MKISEKMIDIIVNELDYIIKSIADADNAVEKLYYFSGIHGAIQRAFNIEYDPDLVFMYYILSTTHQSIMQRIDAIRKGDSVVPVTEHQMNKLLELCKKLRVAITNNNDTVEILKEFILLSYSTSGNGYYLSRKGILEL